MAHKEITKKFARNTADFAPMGSIEKFIKLLPANIIGNSQRRDANIFPTIGADVLDIDFCSHLRKE